MAFRGEGADVQNGGMDWEEEEEAEWGRGRSLQVDAPQVSG